MRAAAALVGMLLVATASAGCGDSAGDDDVDRLRSAVEAVVDAVPRRLVFQEVADGRHVEVEALIDDAFRYKAQVRVDGTAVYEERVVDDALAVRILEPEGFALYRAGDLPKDVEGAFRADQWILDPTGAPDVQRSVRGSGGDDPVADAVDALRWLLAVAVETHSVREFNEFDLDYDPEADPFPVPEEGSGVARFDLLPVALPDVDATEQGGAVPDAAHFRKVAVYVDDGLVSRISEVTEVGDLAQDVVDRYPIEVTGRGEPASQVIDAVNRLRAENGQEPVRLRQMQLDVLDVGDVPPVELPAGDSVFEANLDFLVNRGTRADGPSED